MSLQLHQRGSAHALAVLRVGVFSIWLFLLLATPIQRLGALPRAWFQPLGIMRHIPGQVYDLLLTESGLLVFRLAAIAVCGAALLGVRPHGLVGLLAAVLMLLFDGLMKGYQGFANHAQAGLLPATIILAMFPASDRLTVMPGRPVQRDHALYAAPMMCIAFAICLAYAFIGCRRLFQGGFAFLLGDAVLEHLVRQSLSWAGPYQFDWGLLVLSHEWFAVAVKAGFLITTLFEAASPLCLVSRWFRWAWLLVILPFHLATLVTMNILFWENMVLILLVLTGLPYALAWRLETRAAQRAAVFPHQPDQSAS